MNTLAKIAPDDSHSVPLVVILGLASLQAAGLAFSRLVLRLPHTEPDKPWFRDDILYAIFPFLDSPDAARAGLVCTRWHQNAARASYREVTLHTSSPFSPSLAHTLLHHPELRQHVRHLTVVHSSPHPEAHLYEWIYLLPTHALRTCRIFAVPGPTEMLHNACALYTERVEVACFGYKYPEEVLLRNIAEEDDPARRQRFREMMHGGFVIDQTQQYRKDIEAIAAPTTFPAAIARFAEGIQLEVNESSERRMDILVGGTQGKVTRDQAVMVLEALGKLSGAVTRCSVALSGFSDPDEEEGWSEPATDIVLSDDVLRRATQVGSLERCLCRRAPSSSDGADYPPSALVVGCVGMTKRCFTDAGAKGLVDRVWKGSMPDGRSVRSLNIYLAHSESLPPEARVCATCGLSLVYTFHIPCDSAVVLEALA